MAKFQNLPFFVVLAIAISGGVVMAREDSDRGVRPLKPILSTEEGAMAPPSEWNCDLYVQEYRDWLDQGNRFGDWRFAGKAYRDAGNGERYTAAQWRLWLQEADCPGIAFANDELAVPVIQQLIFGATAVATPIIASQIGAVSPG